MTALSLPSPPYRTTPSMLLKASEHRYLLAAVVGLHLLLGVLIVSGQATPEPASEPQITVSLLDAPAAVRPEPVRPAPAKAAPAPLPRTPKAQAAPQTPISVPTPSPVTTPVAADSAPSPTESRAANPQPPAETRSEAVTQARFDADYLKNPAPVYPPLSRRMNEEGKVILRVSVTPQGLAESIEVKTSSGSERLDQAALKTVRQWKFVPARRGDTAVQSWVLVPVQFKLEQ